MELRKLYFSYHQALKSYKALQEEYEGKEKGVIYARKISDLDIKMSKLKEKLTTLGRGKLIKVTARDENGRTHSGFMVGLDEEEAKILVQIRYPDFNYVQTDILVSGILFDIKNGNLIEPKVL